MENSRDVKYCHLIHIAFAVIVAFISVSGSAFGQEGEIFTPLMIAAKNGNVAAVRTLTVLQIGVNAQTISTEIRFHGTPMEGRTALMFAAQEGHAEVLQILLEHGADTNLKDSNGGSAWTYALDAHHLKILMLLWPKLNVQDRSGYADMSLYVAAEAGDLDIVEFLLGKVSDKRAVSRALAGAAGSGQLEVAKFLVEHGAAITGEVLSRVVQSTTPTKLDVLQYLLDNGADPNARYTQQGVGINGMTPLMMSSYLNSYPTAWDVMNLLMSYGADLDAKDERGKTVLDIARDSNQLDGIRFLKTSGEFVAGSVIDASSGKPIKGAVVSLDFLIRKSGDTRQTKLVQQSLTRANGRFFLHTWQNPLRREAGWELVPQQKPVLRIYAQGYQRLTIEDRFNLKKGSDLYSDQPRALQPMPSASGELLHELGLWKQELTPEVFAEYLDPRDFQVQQVRRNAQKHLTRLFGSVCETLPLDIRTRACYQPCSAVDQLIQTYKYEDWKMDRQKSVAKAARNGVPLAPVYVRSTGCGYEIISANDKSILLTLETPGISSFPRTVPFYGPSGVRVGPLMIPSQR